MPISKRVWKILVGSAVVALASLLTAGAGISDSDVPDDVYSIEATDGQTFASAIFDARLSTNRVIIVTACSNQPRVDFPSDVNTLRIDIQGNHPDEVLIKKKRARVAQRRKGNSPRVLLTGAGDLPFGPLTLTCEKATASGTIAFKETDVLPIEGIFDGKGSRCTGLTPEQAQFVVDTCAFQDFFRTSFDLDTGELKSFSVRGRGIAVIR